MKVILNIDVRYLGEEGDIKNVARGYARNYLFPRGMAVLCTEENMRVLEAKRGEIEERKKAKRQDANSIKERLEALEIKLVMPAGPTGKLYGAVTTQTLFEELAKSGFDIERRRIEIPGNTIKSVGIHTATVKLYENTVATLKFNVEAFIEEPKEEKKPKRGRRRRDEEARDDDLAKDMNAEDKEASKAEESKES